MKRKATEKLTPILPLEFTPQVLEASSKDPSLAEAIAQSPNCPPAFLERLWGQSRRMEKLVVKNPNTPQTLLFQLGKKHPKDFLKNPVLLLVTLEDPGFWSKVPEELLEKILSLPEAPVALIVQSLAPNLLQKTDPVLLALAEHADTPELALLQLAGSRQPYVRDKASKHPKLPKELATVVQSEFINSLAPPTPECLSLCARCGPWLRQVAACDMTTPPEILEALILDEDPLVRKGAASNPSQTPDALDGSLEDPELQPLIARNPSSSLRSLTCLWESTRSEDSLRNNMIRRGLAANPSIPEAMIRTIYTQAQTRSERVVLSLGELDCLAKNPSCPQDILQLLERDRRMDLRESLALNPSLSTELLARLAGSLEENIRRNAASNPSLPKECLEILAQDRSVDVRAQVAKRTDLPLGLRLTLEQDQVVQRRLARERKRDAENKFKF